MNNYTKTEAGKEPILLKKTTSPAFTIIELLVVISIIFLLTATLFPLLRKARGQTRTTVCMSNLKQWALSYQLYATENNSKYPPAEPKSTTQTWMTKLSMYCSDIQSVRNCPSATKVNEDGQLPTGVLGTTKKAWYLTAPFDLSPRYRTGSYAENIYIAQPHPEMEMEMDSQGNQNYLSNFWSGPEDKGAAQTPLLIDSRWYIIAPEETQPLPSDGKVVVNNTTKTWVDSAAMKRHNDGVNTLFLSGSIIKVNAEELWNMKWHKNYKKRGKVPLPNMGKDT
jgi:type II secretory pathway pseudopilin PulG